jgi:hypothetical protein
MILKDFKKMLSKSPQEFRKKFLLLFTKELILNSNSSEVFKLQNILKQEEKEKERKIEIQKEIITKEFLPEIQRELKKPFLNNQRSPIILPRRRLPIMRRRVLKIPRIKLPQNLSYLKPTPTNLEIDLGKLNPLLRDPLVREIHCSGPENPITVVGNMGTKPTSIILTKEEIESIVQKFSQESRIPTSPGIYKVVVGKLIFSAIISEVVGSQFVINKMRYDPKFMPKK